MRGEDAWTTGKFYKVVVQATLLFGLYFLVMTPSIGRTIGGFCHRVAFSLTGKQKQSNTARRWKYLSLEESMAAVRQ